MGFAQSAANICVGVVPVRGFWSCWLVLSVELLVAQSWGCSQSFRAPSSCALLLLFSIYWKISPVCPHDSTGSCWFPSKQLHGWLFSIWLFSPHWPRVQFSYSELEVEQLKSLHVMKKSNVVGKTGTKSLVYIFFKYKLLAFHTFLYATMLD